MGLVRDVLASFLITGQDVVCFLGKADPLWCVLFLLTEADGKRADIGRVHTMVPERNDVSPFRVAFARRTLYGVSVCHTAWSRTAKTILKEIIMTRFVRTIAIALLVAASPSYGAAVTHKYPFMGDWQGTWNPRDRVYPPKIAAQIVPCADGAYQIHFFTELRKKAPEYVVIEAEPAGDKLVFRRGPWSGTIQADRFTGRGSLRGSEGSFEMKKAFYQSPQLGAKPPQAAIVLFDGSDFNEWEMVRGGGETGPVTWKIDDGVMKVVPEFGNHRIGASIGTRRTFSDFHLHIEFRLPLLPENTDQRRGNSGIIIEEFQFFEVQVLDCYGLPGYYDECGAIYQIAPPKVNMCLMPLQWQSYDITFRAPRFDRDGNLGEPPEITVDHNGVLIHKDLVLPYSDNAAKMRRQKPDSRKIGRIKLQDHGYPVEYRNIWIVEKR